MRDMVEIDEDLCDGCGDCVTACAEGAIAVINGKAKLVSEVYCDGLGACLGHCPQGAITVVRREAAAFDESAVAERLARIETAGAAGDSPMMQAVAQAPVGTGCPGSRSRIMRPAPPAGLDTGSSPSQLRHWPVQLHLVPPTAPFFQSAEVLLAADCVAFAVGDFHNRHLAGNSLAIACPKLDNHQDIYLQKLVSMIDDAGIRSLRVMVMEVPCCGGLVHLAEEAVRRARRSVSVECTVVATSGQVLSEYRIAG